MPIGCVMPSSDPTDPVVQVILAYLRQHPQAADSLHGVARWWVGADDNVDVEQVRQALDRLVERGALRRERLADGTDWYCSLPSPRPGTRWLH